MMDEGGGPSILGSSTVTFLPQPLLRILRMSSLPELGQILGLLAVFVVTFIVANGSARAAGHKD